MITTEKEIITFIKNNCQILKIGMLLEILLRVFSQLQKFFTILCQKNFHHKFEAGDVLSNVLKKRV